MPVDVVKHSSKTVESLKIHSDMPHYNQVSYYMFLPQAKGTLAISAQNTAGAYVYANDSTVDDMITYLQYYKHQKVEAGTWKSEQ